MKENKVLKFNDFVNESKLIEEKRETQKSAILDFVEKKGKATWKEIHSFMMKQKGFDPDDKDNRGNMSSYFSGSSSWLSTGKDKSPTGRTANTHGLLMRPTKQDPRYLEKEGKEYVVKIWDGKSKLS